MNIFTNFQMTPYVYHQRTASNTWSGKDASTDYQGFGVWKPRNNSDVPSMNAVEIAEPTLNVKVSEKFINHQDVGEMVGDTVTVPAVGGKTYRVAGVTTAKNFREKRVMHYRLLLQEVA